MTQLKPGDQFPPLILSLPGGDTLAVPDALAGGADARTIGQATGAFRSEDPLFLQSTGFVLDPAGRVVVSVYSSGAIGRLVPEDVIGLIRYLREHAAPAASG